MNCFQQKLIQKLLLCSIILALPAVFTLADDAPQNPLAKPAAVDPFVGTYQSDQMTVTIQTAQSGYNGTIELAGQKFPFTASSDASSLKGQFDSAGNKFDFAAALDGNILTLQSGGRQYILNRVNAPGAVNPLAAPPANPLAAGPAPQSVPQPAPAEVKPAPPPRAIPSIDRPILLVQQGIYFAWAVPIGWKANESPNGVDISSPDGRIGASSVLLLSAFGDTTPKDFIANTLASLKLKDAKIQSIADLPDEPSGLPAKPWKIQQFDVTYTVADGTHIRANLTCAILALGNQYSALLQGYQAPDADFAKAQTWLPFLAQSVTVIDPGKIGMQDRVALPKGPPLDGSPLVELWKAKGISPDRIVHSQQNSTLGYDAVASPSTGKIFEMPFEQYDSAQDGYHSPDDPHEILKLTPDQPQPPQ